MKKYTTQLVLVLAALCVGGFLWLDLPKTALADSEGALPEESGSMAFGEIADNHVPMADLPGAGETDGASQDDADPFSQFTQEQQEIMNEVLELVNAARTDNGLPPLELDPVLCGAAMIRAAECTQTLSHTRPDGTSYKTALTEVGITSLYTGENAASGHTSAQQVVNSWLNSDGHRANILNERFTHLGVGFERNTSGKYKGYAWVQMFVQ